MEKSAVTREPGSKSGIADFPKRQAIPTLADSMECALHLQSPGRMKILLLLLVCKALISVPLRAENPVRPNVVLVLIDDMGWGDFSCFGNPEAKTPNIDRLAGEGIRFSQFYVNAPICSPSRCALVTGQYPQRWRITSYLSNRADNRARGMADWLDPQAPLLVRMLHDAGYATGHFGKWHLGGQRDVADAPPITLRRGSRV